MDAQSGLCLCCSQTPEDRFSHGEAHISLVPEVIKLFTCSTQLILVYIGHVTSSYDNRFSLLHINLALQKTKLHEYVRKNGSALILFLRD